MADTLNKVLYVDQDFATAVAAIQDYLNSNYPDEYNDYVSSNMGQALIDIIGYAEQNLMWYLNRKVTDLYFPTAVTPKSVSKLARMLGYKPKSATFAETPVVVTLKKGPYTFPVTISKGFKFKGPNRSVWEYRGDIPVVFAPGELTKTIQLGQGETLVSNFISTGQNNQVFYLRSVTTGKYVSGSNFVVTVNGVEWPEFDQIPFQVTEAYETNLLSTPPYLSFGDGVQGKIPPLGAAIEVSCVVTDGFTGRILRGGITEPQSNLVASFQTIPVTVSQPDASVGGDDPEDLRSIVVNAPLFQKTQDRAITKTDYDFLSNQYPNVARADAMIIRGISQDLTLQSLYSALRDNIALLKTAPCSVSGGQSVSGVAQTVSGYLDAVYSHIDINFTDSCRGNLVQVAVLAKDANRRYVAPLQATLDGLKAYLESRKDVTHTLAVVAGTDVVIDADLVIDVQASQNAIEDDVVSEITDCFTKSDVAPLGILVERAFNKKLLLWECYQVVRDRVPDAETRIVELDIKITGPTQYLDSKGNLVPPEGAVIQVGTFTINRLPRY